nr:hypothetical protein [Tanacetum cinerariifolium]
LHQPDGVGSKRYHIVPYEELDGIPVAFMARSSLSWPRLDTIARSLTLSLDRSRRRCFIPATPSPRSVNNTSSWFGVVQSSWQWLHFSSGSGNFLHWKWEVVLPVGTLITGSGNAFSILLSIGSSKANWWYSYSMQQTIPELTALCTSLQRQLSELTAKFQAQEVEINRLKERVKILEDKEGVAATRSRDDAPIKGRSMDEGEAATERISDDSEEMVIVLTSMDAATVLASRVVDVPTGSGSIPTASTPTKEQVPTGSNVVPTASPVFTIDTVIDAQVARELEEQLEREDQIRSEQIARDAEIVRIHAEEELQIMINGLDRNNETVAKYL